MSHFISRCIKDPGGFGRFTYFLKNSGLPSVGTANNENSEAAKLGSDVGRHMMIRGQVLVGRG